MPQAKHVQSQLLEDERGEEEAQNKQANSIFYMYVFMVQDKSI